MVGRHSGRVFRLGDRVRVRVTNVSLDERRVDFELAEGPARKDAGPKRRRAPARRRK
jgi:ribonuclease R